MKSIVRYTKFNSCFNKSFIINARNNSEVLTAKDEGCNLLLGADVESSKPKLIVVCKVQGELAAHIIKSHLESEGIPVLLKYESAGKVYGITVDGLGQVDILVPDELAEEAKRIIEPQEIGQDQ